MAALFALSLLLPRLQSAESVRGALSQASWLTLVAENPGARDWSLGDTVRLSYVLETRADTHVTCTRDSRLVSAYLFSVPTHSITVRARRLLLVRNASVENAGRYLCRARCGNASRAVGWRVRVRAHDSCPPAGAKSCHEVQGRPCTPCSCPQGRAFFGKSRVFTCHDAPRGPSGADLKMALNVSRRPYSFEQLEPVVVDYELHTYGDTQGLWGVAKLVTYCLGLVAGVVAFAAVSVMLLRARASAGYASSPEEDEVSKRLGDEGAIMAEAVQMRNRRRLSLETTPVLETGDSSGVSGDVTEDVREDVYDEERRTDRLFVRSLFSRLSDGLILASYTGSCDSHSSDSVGMQVTPSATGLRSGAKDSWTFFDNLPVCGLGSATSASLS
ncbi:hypothetical protein V5799_033336 [Amblyomma americanum]|uniref:Ig-like domain-containing protein n=1 Tax=Amblyomma americanum TaxID=6943 RepID=A0AAQ4DNL3_AMBAM